VRVDRSVSIEPVESLILTIRGQKVILDRDLAVLYGVPTKRLNEQVRRNRNRFPDDFAFELSAEETSEWQRQRSQNATLKRGQHSKYPPVAFTEHGAIMAATVLSSPQAVRMSVLVVRAFVRMREALAATHVLGKRLAEIERTLLAHDSALRDLYQKIRPLLLPPPEQPRREVGFRVKENRARYGMLKHRRR